MAAKVSITRVEPQHIREIAECLRLEDRMACFGLGHRDPEDGLFWSWKNSDYSTAILVDGHAICVGGVVPTEGLGQLWCATSREARSHAVQFCRCVRMVFAGWLDRYLALVALVDECDTRAQRWMRWLGLRIGPVTWESPAGERFMVAVRGRD